MKKTISLILFLTILSGCSVYNRKVTKRNYNKGTIVQKEFTYRIPFRFERDLIFVTASIEGEDYNFIFDTGANSTTISNELFEKLNYKNKRLTILIGDSQGNIGLGSYTEIPELNLGELTFREIGIDIVDLRKNLEFRCLNIEGIFGANHMSKAIWEIDYENQEILVTNDVNYPPTA